jgi:hypothetical protein
MGPVEVGEARTHLRLLRLRPTHPEPEPELEATVTWPQAEAEGHAAKLLPGVDPSFGLQQLGQLLLCLINVGHQIVGLWPVSGPQPVRPSSQAPVVTRSCSPSNVTESQAAIAGTETGT